jgi:hypothetical protein
MLVLVRHAGEAVTSVDGQVGEPEISPQDAKPGDIIYWEQDGPGGDHSPGTVHHAAVVAVVDGDIRYTQHPGGQLNASLDGREPEFQEENGRQKVGLIRPRPDW